MSGFRGFAALLLLSAPLVAFADDEPAPEVDEPAAEEVAPEADEAATDEVENHDGSTDTPPPADDGAGGGRRRRLTAAMVGLETVADDFGNSLAAPMGGIDVAFGHQFDDTFGLSVPIHLSMGSFQGLGTVAGLPAGLTGTLAATVVFDATFIDRVFVGGGGGVGILNNPTGPCLHLRAGGYPVMGRMDDGSGRRRGLSVAADLRMVFVQGFTATYPALTVGYASF